MWFQIIQKNNISLIEELIDAGADVNSYDDDGDNALSALYIASQEGATKIVKLLIDAGANINDGGKEKIPPLYIACQNNHLQIAKLLIDAGADINYCGGLNDVSPLCIACKLNHKKIVKLLINTNGVDLNRYHSNISCPLLLACIYYHENTDHNTDIIKLLIDAGADVNNTLNGKKISPLYMASERGYDSIAKLLIEAGADPNLCKTEDPIPALCIASQEGYINIVNMLIEAGANVNQLSHNNSSSLYSAICENHIEIAIKLIECGADINHITIDLNEIEEFMPHINTIMTSAIRPIKEQFEILRPVFQKIRVCDDSMLIIAIKKKYIEMIKLLINAGTDVNYQTNFGMNALKCAIISGESQILNLLLNCKSIQIEKFNYKKTDIKQYGFYNKICTVCNEDHGKKLLRCSNCEIVGYCSKTCQKKDWKEHKICCNFFSKNKSNILS